MDFTPHPLLRSPHLQTLLSSRLVRGRDGVGAELAPGAHTVTVPCRDGIRLEALVNRPAQPDTSAPVVVMVHGWLGRADSPYIRRAAVALHRAGFAVARLHLRDHGGTAHLNEEMFNAARIDEVVDACNWLARQYGNGSAGLMGFSLGGNFVIRLAAHPELAGDFRTGLAVCPVLDPAAAVTALDRGWFGYRQYFLGKWRQAFAEKEAAFPERYDFAGARRLSLVSTLTDYFVARHTGFRDADDYYSHYTLTAATLNASRIPVRLLVTEDDPVVPVAHARALAGAGGHAGFMTLSRYGGHCAFIQDLRLRSALDPYAVEHFSAAC